MASAPSDPSLFYSRHIFCCTNVRPEGHPRGCCSAGGSEKLRAYMREQAKALGIENIRVNASGCLDRCELGPNMDEILQTHLIEGGRVERLMLQPDQK